MNSGKNAILIVVLLTVGFVPVCCGVAGDNVVSGRDLLWAVRQKPRDDPGTTGRTGTQPTKTQDKADSPSEAAPAETPAPSGQSQTAQELIAKIIESERRIHSLELHYEEELHHGKEDKPRNGRITHWSYDWGYQAGKSYRVDRYLAPREYRDRQSRYACDGEKLYSLSKSGPGEFSGGIGPGGGWGRGFSVIFGYWCSLSEILRDAKQVIVEEEPDEIDGRPCVVVHANEVADGLWRVWDYRFWIDTKRDFQPVRIERDYNSKPPPGEDKPRDWRLDQIELKKIDGIWFPIKGVKTRFDSKPAPGSKPQPDYCKIKALYGQKAVIKASMKWRESVRFVTYERSAHHIISVDPNSVRINKGIDEDKFTIKFPPGCEVGDSLRESVFRADDKGQLVRLRPLEREGGMHMVRYRPERVVFYGNQETIKRERKIEVYPSTWQAGPIKLIRFKTSSDRIKASCEQPADDVLVFTITLKPDCPKGVWREYVEFRFSIHGQKNTVDIPVYITML